MIKILFICHGNICRSPMAEFIMKDLVNKAGLSHTITVDSVAATTEEIGHDMYPPAKRKLTAMGIPFSPRRARLITHADYDASDLILVMDEENVRHLRRRLGEDSAHKIHYLMDYAGVHREVADPWYTGDFDQTYDDILAGCRGVLNAIAHLIQ